MSITLRADVKTTFASPFAPSLNWSTSHPMNHTSVASLTAVNTPFPEAPAATKITSTPSPIKASPTTLPVASSLKLPI